MTKKKTTKTLENKLYRIAIYVRVSTEEQAENPEGSIKNQEQRIREYIKLKNMVEPFGEVVVVFSDPGKSAKDMNRPGFQKMLGAIRSQEINMVVVTELSRFSRSTKDFTMLQEFLEEHGCKFLSLRENFDTSGAAGSMVMNLMASIAEFERRQTAERISNSFLARSKRGLYNGGSLPLGYRIDDSKPGHLFIDPDEAEIVRFAFRAFIKQGTLAATAKFLTANKISLPRKVHGSGAIRESQFTVDSLYRMLRNKAYIGIRVFQTKAGPEEVPAVWEPIIEVQLFERVNELLKQNCNHKRTHGENRYPYTLSGITFCEQCGERMSGKSAHGKAGKVGYYEHTKTSRLQSGNPEKLKTHNPHRVPAIKLEPVVWQEVKNFVLSDSFASDLLERARLMQEAKNQLDELSKLRQKLRLTENQIEVLAERIAILPKELDLKPLMDQLVKLQNLKTDLELTLKTQQSEKIKTDEPISFESLAVFRKGLKSLIEKGEKDKNVQTTIIKKIVHKITIKPDGFEIHFHVGKSYYSREPGVHTPGSLIFLFKNGNKESLDLEKPAKKSQSFNFFKDQGSSLLTNGDPSNPISKPLQPLGITRITLSEKTDYSKEIVEKYLSGCSASEIGGLFSFSKQKVLAILKKQKINIRPAMVVTTRTAVLKQKSKSGAKPFYGFCYFEGALNKHPIEFPVLLKIHRMWVDGRTIHQVNQELDRRKIKSREGKNWSWAAIRNIVQRFEQKILIIKSGGQYELR